MLPGQLREFWLALYTLAPTNARAISLMHLLCLAPFDGSSLFYAAIYDICVSNFEKFLCFRTE